MADESKVGTHWQDDELDAIVADYFDMLAADLAGRPYVKSRHSAALMEQIGRTHRSVDFQHQNISAVLDELGMPWISGYIPKRNYQNASGRLTAISDGTARSWNLSRKRNRRVLSRRLFSWSLRHCESVNPCLPDYGALSENSILWNAII